MKKVLLCACLGWASFFSAKSQLSLTPTGFVKENFNSMQTGSNLSPGWQMSPAGGGASANYQNPVTTNFTSVAQVASSGSPTTGGAYNWGTTGGTDRAIGFMTNGYASPNAILAHIQNNTGSTVTSVTVTFQIEQYRSNTSGFYLQFYDSPNGSTWTERSDGNISAAVYQPGSSTYTFATPRTVYKTVTITGLSLASGGSYYLRWVFHNVGSTNSQGLGLDNVEVSVNTTSPSVTATLSDALTTDVNGNSKANEGDKLTYTATLKSSGKEATDVQYTAPLDANTTLSGDVRSTPLAVDDNFSTALNTAAAGNVKTNDFGLPAAAFNVVSFGSTETPALTTAGGSGMSDNGGTVMVSADGTFSYTPPTGFVGYDRFAYTLAAGVAPNDVGIVTIAVGSVPSATAESFSVLGNVSIGPNAASGVLINDGGSGISIGAVNNNPGGVGAPITTTNGGTVTLQPDGSFTYNPAPGFTGSSDNFSYSVDNGFSSPVTVQTTLNVTGMIWFINNTAGSGGDGRLSSPFNSLAGVSNGAGGIADNQTIFVYSGSGNYDGGIILKNGQKLFGQGATSDLAILAGVTVPAHSATLPSTGGTAPVITNTSGNGVSLASGNTLRGFAIGNASGNALSGTSFGTLNVSEVSINTTGQAINLNTGTLAGSFTGITSSGGLKNVSFSSVNSSSAIDLGSGALSGATDDAFYLSGGTLSLTYAGNITHSNTNANAGLMQIQGTHTGTLTLNSGTLSATGSDGLLFSDADGTYNFNGTTTINATSGITFQNGSSGTFNFSSGTSVTNPSNGACFHVIVSSPNVTYNGSLARSGTSSGALVNLTDVSGGTITFQNGTLSSTSSAGTGIRFSNADGTVNFTGNTTLNGGDAGIDILNGSGGSFTFASGTAVTNPTNQVISIDNSSANVTYSGTFSKTSVGQGIAITNNTGAKTITFDGTGTKSLNTSSGNAINITGNSAGTTVNFSGNNLILTTTTGIGFNATGGGTIRVSGTGNTISSGTGTALNVANTNIGAPAVVGQGGLNFQSISANGAANGIVLSTTGTNGGLAISGTGTSNSGGIIQNTTGVGISLINTSNVSLNWIQIANTGSHGISGTGMIDGTGGIKPTLEILNSLLNSPGDGDNESAIYFDNLGVNNILGRLKVINCTIQNFEDVGVHVGNISGTLTVDIDDCVFNNNSDTNGEEGIDIDASGTATINVTITDSRFQELEGGSMNIVSQGSGTIDLTVNNIVDIGTGGPDNFPTPPAMTFSSEGINSNFFADITNNKILDASGDGIFVGHEGEISVRIAGNTITGMATGDGIRIDTDASGNQTTKFLIENNSIGTAYMFESLNYSGCGDDGIQILDRDGTKVMHLTIRNNQISNTASEAIRHFADDDVSGGGPDDFIVITGNTFSNIGVADAVVIVSQDPGTMVCTHISGNSFVGANRNIWLQQSLSATLGITQTSVAAMAAANTNATASSIGTITFNGTCTTPVLPSH